jgi:hypothetical protein
MGLGQRVSAALFAVGVAAGRVECVTAAAAAPVEGSLRCGRAVTVIGITIELRRTTAAQPCRTTPPANRPLNTVRAPHRVGYMAPTTRAGRGKRTGVDTSYNERNRAQTERLRSLRRLSDEDLRRPVGEHWTVAVALAHIQYWDGRTVGALEAWRRYGLLLTLYIGSEAVVNDLLLPFWRELAPREVLEQAIKTAEVLDRIVADLTPVEAEAAYRVLDHSLHRSNHLDEVDGRSPSSSISSCSRSTKALTPDGRLLAAGIRGWGDWFRQRSLVTLAWAG